VFGCCSCGSFAHLSIDVLHCSWLGTECSRRFLQQLSAQSLPRHCGLWLATRSSQHRTDIRSHNTSCPTTAYTRRFAQHLSRTFRSKPDACHVAVSFHAPFAHYTLIFVHVLRPPFVRPASAELRCNRLRYLQVTSIVACIFYRAHVLFARTAHEHRSCLAIAICSPATASTKASQAKELTNPIAATRVSHVLHPPFVRPTICGTKVLQAKVLARSEPFLRFCRPQALGTLRRQSKVLAARPT